LPEHVVWFGAHDPVHVPETQVWLAQAVPADHCPEALHVSGWFIAEQLTCPGAHDPWQAPLTHVWLLHATAAPYCPLGWHVSTPLPEHVV
jgi:hypothetical protein